MALKQTILACFLACGLSAIASTAHATIVRLHSSVTVDKALIHLGDVADIFADDDQAAAELSRITLDTSPIPGNSTRLKLDEIRSRLLKFRIEVGALEFQGSSIVVVTRRGQLPASASPWSPTKLAGASSQVPSPQPFRRTELASYSTPPPRKVFDPRDIPIADIRLAETVIHDLVKDYLSEWAPDWGAPIIHPLLATPDVPTILSARAGNLKIVSGRPLTDDLFSLTVAVPTGEFTTPAISSEPAVSSENDDAASESAVKSVQVRVRVTRRPKVLAARRIIAQGQVIRETDLEWREVDDIRNGTSDPATIVGMEARINIRQGDLLKSTSVKPPTLINRDELVKVTVQSGTIRLTRTLKARRAGILNDIIELVSLDRSNKETMLVRVTGKGTAEPLNTNSKDDAPAIRLTVNEG
ncbi:MAG: flagellar basal body P-ring formation chaperone FlgA [Planctomycetota bacterium]|nr:flagellar basal body P-ring formation chaperone FlgA [Planctomycetota bacterium]